MRSVVSLVMFAVMVPVDASEPDSLYESVADVRLGRLFTTQEQRVRLEARRGLPVDETAGPEAPADTPAPEVREAAGVIISNRGRALVWRGGAFRRTDPSQATRLRFPGEVTIRRSHASDKPVEIPAVREPADDPESDE